MKDREIEQANHLESTLVAFSKNVRALPGIAQFENRLALVEQFLESIRRVQYVHVIHEKELSLDRANPLSNMFDPLKAAVIHRRQGNIEEACWLVFLATHFGKHRTTRWRLTQDIYGGLGAETPWSWEKIIVKLDEFGCWLKANYGTLTGDGTPRHFGNHRKYETLRPSSNKGTAAVITSYVNWILRHGSHVRLFADAAELSYGDPRATFRKLYHSMDVLRFGRTAKFDYLTMLGKLRLAPIEADSAYLIGATGPLRGAHLLFEGSVTANGLTVYELDAWLLQLAETLGLGMQEMEDALCNWQKSPNRFIRFRG